MVTGNTITAADVTQLVDAFTAGGGYSVSISGSVTGSATSASYATTAATATTTTSASFASTSSVAYGVQYNKSAVITGGIYPPGTDFPVIDSTPSILFLNTSSPIGLAFGVGYEGQQVKLTTNPQQSEITNTNVSISASGQLLGLNSTTVTGGSPALLSDLSLVGSMQSCEFYYMSGTWYFVGSLATP